MTARALERHAVAQAADGDVRDAEPGAIDRDEAIDLPFQPFAEQVLDAAQIAESFFADGADEGDGARRAEVVLDDRARDGEQHREAAAIVADARAAEHRPFALHRDVRAFGKHRVEMRAEHEMRARLRAAPFAEDVAFLVDADVGAARRP